MRLTAEQQEAVERRDGPLFLQAGAGSGKTRVLVERFVRSVLDDEVAVDRLLAITFTEKAAAELKGRIRRRFLELGEREHARDSERAWVSTIHGFCARLLRANALAAGIDPDFRVLDESRAALDAVMVDEFQDTNRLQNELLDLISDGNLFTVGDELQSIYGFRNADVEVFRGRRDAAEADGRARRLATSFRARPGVLDVVNRAFATVWDDYPPLTAGREEDPAAGPRVDLIVTDMKKQRWDDAVDEAVFGDWMVARKVPAWRASIRASAASTSSPGPAARTATATWPCCCARRATWTCTSARSPIAGCPPTPSGAGATGASSR